MKVKVVASMVVDEALAPKRVAQEFGIPYTTVTAWVQRYRLGEALLRHWHLRYDGAAAVEERGRCTAEDAAETKS